MATVATIKQKAEVSKSTQLKTLIEKSLAELGKAVPSCMNAERLGRIALTTIRLNPKLAECTPESFLGALFQSAQLGLEPNVEGQAYLIPYTNSKKINGEWVKVNEVQFQIGYKGYIELFYRHSSAEFVDMHTVYENDIFECEYGSNAHIKHIPTFKNRGEVIGYYAVAKIKNGGSIFKFMNLEECLEHGKTHSKCIDKATGNFQKGSVWDKDQNAMCKKTVLIQLAKLMPKSIELQKALAMDGTTKSNVSADMFNIPDTTNWVEDYNNVAHPTE